MLLGTLLSEISFLISVISFLLIATIIHKPFLKNFGRVFT